MHRKNEQNANLRKFLDFSGVMYDMVLQSTPCNLIKKDFRKHYTRPVMYSLQAKTLISDVARIHHVAVVARVFNQNFLSKKDLAASQTGRCCNEAARDCKALPYWPLARQGKGGLKALPGFVSIFRVEPINIQRCCCCHVRVGGQYECAVIAAGGAEKAESK